MTTNQSNFNATPDPVLGGLLDGLARAERDAAGPGFEDRIADVTVPGRPALRLVGEGSAWGRGAWSGWALRCAVAAGLALAAGATWYATRAPSVLTPTIATPDGNGGLVASGHGGASDTADYVLTVAFGDSSWDAGDLASISADADALGAKVTRTISPEDAFLTDGAS